VVAEAVADESLDVKIKFLERSKIESKMLWLSLWDLSSETARM
jgi:hypothetical protein